MTFIDLIIILIIAAFVFFGLFFGLVHTIGSLIATILGIVISTRFIDPAFKNFGFIFGGGQFAKVIVFIILFALVSRIIGVIFWFIGGFLNMISFIPFAGAINRLLGAVFGLVEGVIVVAIILFYAMQVLPKDMLFGAMHGSIMAKYLMAVMTALQVFIPERMRLPS